MGRSLPAWLWLVNKRPPKCTTELSEDGETGASTEATILGKANSNSLRFQIGASPIRSTCIMLNIVLASACSEVLQSQSLGLLLVLVARVLGIGHYSVARTGSHPPPPTCRPSYGNCPPRCICTTHRAKRGPIDHTWVVAAVELPLPTPSA